MRHRSKAMGSLLSLYVLLLGTGLLCAQNAGQPAAKPSAQATLREVRVRLDWTPWAPHAALYAAEDQGYFKEVGLSVKMYVPPDPESTISLVAAGQDEFGISYMTDAILAREQGLKVISIAALIAHPLNSIMTLKKSGIAEPSKLSKTTIGTTGVPSDQAFLEWVLKKNGVDKDTVRLVNLGFNLAPALKSGNVDAIVGAYWPWEGIKLEEEQFPVNIFRLQDYGVPDYYELVLVSRDDLVKQDPNLVRGFLKAIVRGQEFVQQNPARAVDILRRVSPDLDKEFLTAAVNATVPLMQFPNGIFQQESGKWSEMIQFMLTAGLLKKAPEVSTLFTNEYFRGPN